MHSFSFCPNSRCSLHLHAPDSVWFVPAGHHLTKAFGRVPRFKCRACGKTFSVQTFSIDYFAKRIVDYPDLLTRQSSSESLRALSRALKVSCGTITNKLDRLARQAAALQSRLRVLATPREDVCADGFVDFAVSQFFPSEIVLSITAHSRFILDLSHATRRRSGTMTIPQKLRAGELYKMATLERGAIGRSFREILDSLQRERPPSPEQPLVVITDEKKEYDHAFRTHPLFLNQDSTCRAAHRTINSSLPRTYWNPLFASNYLDREIRKDMANHHRESTCFTRNVSNGMSRLLCYIVHHNYRKRYLVRAPIQRDETHAEIAGISREEIEMGLVRMFREREFLSRIRLPPTIEKIWGKTYPTPLKIGENRLPRFAFG
jgi:hypothetical protein